MVETKMTNTEWKLTGKLRWLVTTDWLILQQEWRREKFVNAISTDFGPGVFTELEIEWRDVPKVSE